MNTRNLAPGLILIALGALFFVQQLTDVGGEAVVAIIGGAFLVAYTFTRQYGFLVPGGIMTGLGLGIVLQNQGAENGGVVVIGLGLGFMSVYAIDLFVRRSTALWWPIIPGGILTAIGTLVEADQVGILRDLELAWPLVLIAIGLVVLFTQARRGVEPPAGAPKPEANAAGPQERFGRPEATQLTSEPTSQQH